MTIRRADWLAVLLAAGAGLHAAAVLSHRDYVPYVAFFAGTALLGAGAAVLVVARPSLSSLQPLLLLGNLALLGVWVLARTAGVPFGPEAGLRHAIGVHDALAAATALAVVAGLLARSTTRRSDAGETRPVRVSARMAAVGAVVALAAWGGAAAAEPLNAHATSDRHVHADHAAEPAPEADGHAHP